MSRGPDAGVLLERALLANARAAGCAVAIVDAQWQRWASATFAGARHTLLLDGTACAALEHWVADLPEADLAIRGGLVADLTATSVRCSAGRAQIAIEALTIEA